MRQGSGYVSSEGEILRRKGDLLPHWSRGMASYHVTFRLADSLPQVALEQIREERERILSINRLSEDSRRELDYLMSKKIDDFLDSGVGECYLRNSEVAAEIWSSLSFFDGERYDLFARCLMPNHVHLLIQPLYSHGLDEIIHSIKSFTANRANKILGRKGRFWMPEYYDHMIRSEAEFERVRMYIRDNPVKAGLINWKWVE